MPGESDGERWEAFAHGREWLRGDKPEEPEAYPHAGLVGDDRVRRLLSVGKALYDPSLADEPMPARFEETELYRHLVGVASTETVTRAVHEERSATLSHAVGDPAAKADVSGLGAVHELEEILSGRAPVLYIYGHMGAGKTSKALLACQLYAKAHGGDPWSLDGVEVASNLRSFAEADEHLNRFGEVKSWFEENTERGEGGAQVRREGATPKIYVHDEASSTVSGRGAQGAQAGTEYAPLVYAVRKARGALVLVGHDGKDVHPVFRALGVVVEAHRDEPKRMTVWEDVVNREGRGKLLDLRGVPDTDLTVNDGEQPTFRFGEAGDDDDDQLDPEAAAEVAEEATEAERRRLWHALESTRQSGGFGDLSQAELGAALGVSGSVVSKWFRRIERGEYDPSEVATPGAT